MTRHPDQGCPGFKPRHAGNGHSVDKLNADYLETRNQTAAAKLRLHELKVGEAERRLLPVSYVQSILSDVLTQLRQHMLSVPNKFRTIDPAMTQMVGDWLRDDINRALTRASEIRPALLDENPWSTWYRDHAGKDEDLAKQKRTAKRTAKT